VLSDLYFFLAEGLTTKKNKLFNMKKGEFKELSDILTHSVIAQNVRELEIALKQHKKEHPNDIKVIESAEKRLRVLKGIRKSAAEAAKRVRRKKLERLRKFPKPRLPK